MKMHICMYCRGVFYGYPESTRYCYACKASSMMPVDLVDYNFDYSRNASKAFAAGSIIGESAKNHGRHASRPSESIPKDKSRGKTPSINGRNSITLGMGIRAFLTGRPLRL
ncbi:hypothetical protein OnM2_017086 [Erysiphe neolycopersici]|uniref:Uncharacterized protein n=1 Tax=Erysiphe neolycopersici TaxID=212602 RepID=A0A420I4K8_9PEZI|nr:hypothetical protein OnM2_017086 [Erysiphe neolycopersici]